MEPLYFTRAYLWDISSHSFPIHHKLSQEDLFLTSEALSLAEEVLNADMLHLIGMYQKSLGGAGAELTATMEMLKNTRRKANC